MTCLPEMRKRASEGARFCDKCGARVVNDSSRSKELEKETGAGPEKNADEQAFSVPENNPEKGQPDTVSPEKKGNLISRLFEKRRLKNIKSQSLEGS